MSKTATTPLIKIKRVARGMYRVYKFVNGNYKIKRTFFTIHQANRYVKGMGPEAKKKIKATEVSNE